VSVIFATIHWYNSAEFIEVLLAQPVSRKRIFISEFVALSLAVGGAFILATGIPLLIFYPDAVSLLLMVGGFFLTIIFIALAFWSAVFTRDKAKGIGLSLVFWLYFSLIYDGLILMIMFNFSDYPIDKIVVALLSFNPVDVSRVMILMKMEMSAMLGYSGAVFTDFLGSSVGLIYSIVLLIIWSIVPFFWALRKFSKKDL
jgi:Cu-processing system permease protein